MQVNFAAYVGARLTPEDVFDTVIATLSFRSVDTIILIMILFTLFVLAVVLCILLRQFWVARRAQTFRLSGGKHPELTLQEGHRWHLFLSHTERTSTQSPLASITVKIASITVKIVTVCSAIACT